MGDLASAFKMSARTSWDFARGARQPIAATPAAICAALDAAGMTFAGENRRSDQLGGNHAEHENHNVGHACLDD